MPILLYLNEAIFSTMTIKNIFFKNIKAILSLTFLVLCFKGALAQNNINFEHISTNDGLSQSDINCIYQDKEGFMWFGTFDGLNKYDGYTFKNYLPKTNDETSISSNIVFTITGDNNGALWIGTTGGGLNRFDKKTEKFTRYKYDTTIEGGIDSDVVRKVFVDSKNRLWVGTDKGLNVVNLSQNIQNYNFEHVLSERDLSIKAIYEDLKGNIWISTNRKLFNVVKNKNGKYEFLNVNFNSKERPQFITSLGENKKGEIVAGTSKGLFSIVDIGNNQKQLNIRALKNINVKDFLIDDKNQYWLGATDGLYLYQLDEGSGILKEISHFEYDPIDAKSISKNIINCLYQDKTGIIWIGTNGGGINKVNPQKKRFQHIKRTSSSTSLSYDKIRSFCEDSYGNLWIGTEGGGLNLLSKKNNEKGPYNQFQVFPKIDRVFALIEANINGKQKLLIGSGTNKTIYKIDLEDGENSGKVQIEPFFETDRATFALLQDFDNIIWAGTYGGGLYRIIFDKSSNSYKKDVFRYNASNNYSISDDIIRSIYEDKKGDIWIGTGNGLSRLEASEKLKDYPKFKFYRNKEDDTTSISHNYIMPIYETSKGELYIGTFGGGINKFVPGKDGSEDKFVSYNLDDGLANNVVKSILEDDLGNLWLSTNKGLSKFNPKTKVFKNYDVNDGLQDNEFQELAGIKRKNGDLIFGGINGYNVFSPSEIKNNDVAPETVISSFSVFNKEVEVGKEYNGKVLLDSAVSYTKKIHLKYDQNSFSIEFSGLHFAAPLKNKFLYQLKGYDQNWYPSNSSKKFANYTNIPPGNYIFKVKSSNGDGVWDKTPSKIKIIISPPFWRTYLAYILYGLLIVGLLIAFRRYAIISTTKKHQFELQDLEKEKNEELQRDKLEFFTNVSHEFRTPLTLIKGPLEYLKESKAILDNDVLLEQCEVMDSNVDYLMRLVNQLLDFRKINQGKMQLVIRHTEIIKFIKDIGEPFQFIAHKKNINFNIKSENKTIKAWFDHDALEKIMKNLLSNAFKFTPDSGEINVEIAKEDAANHDECFVVIKVRNSGNGISKEEIENIFDRFYSKTKKIENTQTSSGIGLAFTKSLINRHKGEIEVESEPNGMISFSVRLPRKKSIYENIEEISIKEKDDSDFLIRSSESESLAIDLNDEIEDAPIGNKRSKSPILLVVDDNKDIRKLIKNALKSTFEILEAANGVEGLKIANEVIPNIILTDVLMPEMGGIEFCNQLKSNNKTSHIPVIMLTAKTSKESEIEGLTIGADGYVKKPFDLKVLRLKLSNTLNYRQELRRKFNREVTLQPEEVTVTSIDEKFLENAIKVVEKHMMNTDFSVELMVQEMGLSRSHLYIKIKELTGLSSSAFIRNIRLKRAVQLLEQSNFTVKEIMYMTGFNTSSYFSKCFKKQFGVLPRDYIKNLKAEKAKLKDS